VLVVEEAAVAVAEVRTLLVLAVVSACLVRVPAEMVVLAPQQMALVALGVLQVLTPLKPVLLLPVTSMEQVTYQRPAFVEAVGVAPTTLLSNKVSVARAVSASSGDPTGPSRPLTPVTCNSHGY
jgi:hypothetical protein